MPQSAYTTADFIKAQEVCAFMSENLQIQFRLSGDSIPKDEAQRHFNERAALNVVREMLICEAERIAKK